MSAFLRRGQAQGHYGAVIRKGAAEAGSVFVVVNHLDRTFHLFGPAPGPAHDEAGERRWIEEVPAPAQQEDVDRVLNKRIAADPDIWIVEIEDREGTAGLKAAVD